MLQDKRGEMAVKDVLFLGILLASSAVTAFFIITLSIYKTLFLFATVLLCIFTFANINLGLLFIVALMEFPNIMPRQMFGIVGINPFNLLFGAVIGVVILRIIVHQSTIRFAESFYLPLILIFLLQGIAILRFQNASHLTTLENTQWLMRFFKPMQYVILLILIVNFIRSKQISSLIIIILLGFVLASSILFSEWLRHGFAMTMTLSKDVTHLLWANPTFGHKVSWGTMFTLNFFFVLAILGQRFSNWNLVIKILSWISLGLLGFMIAVSLARVAYGCFLIGMFYFFWKKGRFQLVVTLLILVLAIFLLPEIVRLRATQDLPTTWNTNSLNRLLSGRLIVRWVPAIKAFVENPLFGRGFNGAGIYVLGQAFFTFPHSGYIATLCDMGIIGLAVMIWLFISFWKYCCHIYVNTKSQLTRRLSLGCRTQILILAFSNLSTDFTFFYNPMVVAPFFLSAAMLFSLYRDETEGQVVETSALPVAAVILPSSEQISSPIS